MVESTNNALNKQKFWVEVGSYYIVNFVSHIAVVSWKHVMFWRVWVFLVGDFNLIEKYMSIGINSPSKGASKNIRNHHLGNF